MCFNPSPVRRVPSPNRYIAVAKFCFSKNNKRLIDCEKASRGPLRVLLKMLPTHARAHAHTCPHTRTDPEFGFLYFFGVSMCGVAAPA